MKKAVCHHSLVLLAVTSSLVAQVRPDVGVPAPVEAKKVAPRPAIRVIKLKGTPYERGVAHGKALKDEIHALVKLWKADLKKTYRVEADEFIARFRDKTDFELAIGKWTPSLLDEVRGIAAGCGLDYDTIYVYQLIDEIWAQGEKVMAADKCTAIGVDRRDGQPTIVAQNLDIPRWYHGFQTLLHITDEKAKLQTFVVTLPGLVGANGMNSARVGVCVNTMLQLRPCADGLPVAFVVRGVLAHKDWHKARGFLYDVRHASGQNYTLGGPDVAHSFECSAHRVKRFRPFDQARHTWHTNHPLVNEEWSERFAERAKTVGKQPREILRACPRFAWLEARMGAAASAGGRVVDLDAVRAALASKGSGVPICNASTFACTIMLLGGVPELRFSAGGADRHRLQIFRFDSTR
jgi:isopenicillin-N N-acyltransferase like protein